MIGERKIGVSNASGRGADPDLPIHLAFRNGFVSLLASIWTLDGLDLHTCLLSVALPFVLVTLAIILTLVARSRNWSVPGGLSDFEPDHTLFKGISTFVGVFVGCMLLINFEEGGWRAYALPKMVGKDGTNALAGSLLLGAIWGLWHFPIFFWKEYALVIDGSLTRKLVCFAYYAAGLAVISYKITGVLLSAPKPYGSFLPALLFHSSLNASVAAWGVKRLNALFLFLNLVAWIPVALGHY